MIQFFSPALRRTTAAILRQTSEGGQDRRMSANYSLAATSTSAQDDAVTAAVQLLCAGYARIADAHAEEIARIDYTGRDASFRVRRLEAARSDATRALHDQCAARFGRKATRAARVKLGSLPAAAVRLIVST